jgi:antirestriction protein ArdC
LQALKDDKQLIFKASAQANKAIQYIEGCQLDSTHDIINA